MIKVKVNPLIVAILISLATGSTFYLMAGYWLANSPLLNLLLKDTSRAAATAVTGFSTDLSY